MRKEPLQIHQAALGGYTIDGPYRVQARAGERGGLVAKPPRFFAFRRLVARLFRSGV
ncbi:hypothetical protein BLA13014_00406 [Burkholderia aenigmatica]|uniref:Uncharacterized protein n=1 Tax=Burkholderia aenigmatica TaxID=2015348 RepID=A0A6P2HH76_9BURK|nr:hypothetical protein BLA13014_00406 [Burkholderia aenigmatica]